MDVDHLRQLRSILKRFDISCAQPEDLAELQEWDIVALVDDSTSMRWPASLEIQTKLGIPSSLAIRGGHLQDEGGGAMVLLLEARAAQQPFQSRWDELQFALALIVDLGSAFDTSGVDVWFLNRPEVCGITGSLTEKFQQALTAAPSGGTPLAETMQKVVAQSSGAKPVLLFVLTDGEPDGGHALFTQTISDIVEKRSTPHDVRLQIMACTADKEAVDWLNKVDKEFATVDVTDDYYSELNQVLKEGGLRAFTRGDWCMKAMLGAINTKFDMIDEGNSAKRRGTASSTVMRSTHRSSASSGLAVEGTWTMSRSRDDDCCGGQPYDDEGPDEQRRPIVDCPATSPLGCSCSKGASAPQECVLC